MNLIRTLTLTLLLLTVSIAKADPNSDTVVFQFPDSTFKLTESKIETVEMENSTVVIGKYRVFIKLKPEAAAKLNKLTANNIQKNMDILFKGETIQSPTIMAPIDRQFYLDDLSKDQAQEIVDVLTAEDSPE